jgi:hypothetical protein
VTSPGPRDAKRRPNSRAKCLCIMASARRASRGAPWGLMARTFGERFVEEFRRAGGSTAAWAPAAVDAIKKADRRAFIASLNKVSSASAKTLVIAAHTAEPETLARRAVEQARAHAADNDPWPEMLAFMVIT